MRRLARKLLAVRHAVSKDPGFRPWLGGVHFADGRVEASDGHMALRAQSDDLEGLPSKLVEATDVEHALKRARADKAMSVEVRVEEDGKFRVGDVFMNAVDTDQQFPNLELVMPKGDVKAAVHLDLNLLERAVKAFKEMAPAKAQRTVRIEIRDELGAVMLKGANDIEGLECVIMPKRP